MADATQKWMQRTQIEKKSASLKAVARISKSLGADLHGTYVLVTDAPTQELSNVSQSHPFSSDLPRGVSSLSLLPLPDCVYVCRCMVLDGVWCRVCTRLCGAPAYMQCGSYVRGATKICDGYGREGRKTTVRTLCHTNDPQEYRRNRSVRSVSTLDACIMYKLARRKSG